MTSPRGDRRLSAEGEGPTGPTKLGPDDVKLLSFEGGGGKGGAYIGALAALSHEDVGILKEEKDGERYVLDTDRIQGVSGASAGAITATMLASEYSLSQLAALTLDNRLLRFFDNPGQDRSYYPVVRHGPVEPTNLNGRAYLSVESYKRDSKPLAERKLVKTLGKPAVKFASRILGSDSHVGRSLDNFTGYYAQNMYYDYGFFSGIYARSYLSERIVQNAPRRVRKRNLGGNELTFSDHYKQFGRTSLALVGTNVTTGEARYFRTGETGSFKVADAVRISMGIPFAFKPVRVPKSEFSSLSGHWVDGGTLNNNPIHAFDTSPGTLASGMLGLRLGVDERNEIDGIKSFAGATATTVLAGSSKREIRNEQEQAQTIPLPVEDLETFVFLPDQSALREAATGAAAAVFRYFREATGSDIGVDPDATGKVERFLKGRVSALWQVMPPQIGHH